MENYGSHKKIKYYGFYIFILWINHSIAQNTKIVVSKRAVDFIELSDTLTYTVSENSFTHNSVLLKIQAQITGNLTFTISSNLPHETINFTVYKNNANLQVDNLFDHKSIPIRYNYSNSDTNAYVLKGLNKTSKLHFIENNTTNKFNAQLGVKNREIIYLLLERKAFPKPQNYNINFQITEKKCVNIPIVNDKGKLVTSTVEYYYDNKHWWSSTNAQNKIDVCYHPEKQLHVVTVVANNYFPCISDVKILCKNNIDCLKLKLFRTDSIYKLQLISFNHLNKLNLANSKISLNTYIDFIKKNRITKFIILYDSLNSINKTQALELYNYFKNKFTYNIRIETLNDPTIKLNNDTGLAIRFPK